MAPTRPEDRSLKFSTTGKCQWLSCGVQIHSDMLSFTVVLRLCFPQRSEYDGDLQSQLLSKANEEDKNCSRALSVVSAVVRAAKDLLHRAFAVDGNHKTLVVSYFQ